MPQIEQLSVCVGMFELTVSSLSQILDLLLISSSSTLAPKRSPSIEHDLQVRSSSKIFELHQTQACEQASQYECASFEAATVSRARINHPTRSSTRARDLKKSTIHFNIKWQITWMSKIHLSSLKIFRHRPPVSTRSRLFRVPQAAGTVNAFKRLRSGFQVASKC